MYVILVLLTLQSTVSQEEENPQMSKTFENVLLETDLYKESSTANLKQLEKAKMEQMRKVKQGDKISEMNVKELHQKEISVSDNLKELNKYKVTNRLDIVSKIKPLPPCPPREECRLEGLGAILVPSNVRSFKLQVLNDKNEQIGSISKKALQIDKQSQLYPIELKEYKGPIIIKIQKISSKGIKENYEVKRILL